MLGLRDTFTLAATKLRTRRIRLIVTLVVSGLLFAVLVAGSLLIRGMVQSLDSFNQERLAKRFFVEILLPSHMEYYYNPIYITRAQVLDHERSIKQAAEAKRLGIAYDPKVAPQLVINTPDDPYGKQQLSYSDPLTQQALLELAPRNVGRTDVADLLRQQGVTGVYVNENLQTGFSANGPTLELTPVVAGAEIKASTSYAPTGQSGSLSTFGVSLQADDNHMLEPFLLPGEHLATKPGDPVPVVAPIDAAERLLGLKALSDKTTPAEKIARLKAVRERIRDYTLSVCYRNAAELDRRKQAQQYVQDALAHKDDKSWSPPELVYAEAALPCQPVVVKSDKRSAETKAAEAAQAAFKQQFDPVEAPAATMLNFRIVGITPQSSATISQAASLDGLVQSLLSSSLGEGWFMSAQGARQQPLLSKILDNPINAVLEGGRVYAEFPDRVSQKAFIEKHNCTDLNDAASVVDCARQHRYIMMPYGNPLVTLYDAQPQFMKWFQILVLIIAGLSAVIMMGTIGKIIADGRKETSVFRALGAKRLDIGQTYLLYVVMLASLAFGVALVIGAAAAGYVEITYSGSLSARAIVAYNSADLTKHFGLIGLNLLDLALVYALALVAGLAAAMLPLLTNLRRNPIKDMREE